MSFAAGHPVEAAALRTVKLADPGTFRGAKTGCAAVCCDQANLFLGRGQSERAIQSYREAIRLQSDHVEAWTGLGTALQQRGELQEAADAFRQATLHAPDRAEAHTNYGAALLELESHDAAERALRTALALVPQHAAALGTLGVLLLRRDRPMAAEAASRQAALLAPAEPRWLATLGCALQVQGRHAEAEATLRRALALRPGDSVTHGHLLSALRAGSGRTAEQVSQEFARWDARHAQPLMPQGPAYALDPLQGRRLRVGYMTRGASQPAVSLYTKPMLSAHDRSVVELFLYDDISLDRSGEGQNQRLAEHWRSTRGQDDAAVAEMIRRDRIDVLVDLAGRCSGNRLLVFARKPAPVQIGWLSGHGFPSGLSVLDGFLADNVLAPDDDALFADRIVRLPRIPIVYQPPATMPPVAPLPAATNGFVTFGYFGRPERLGPDVITAWSRVLLAVPGARLVLNHRTFQEAAFRDLVAGRFDARGIGRDRLNMTYTAPQRCTWVAYGAIDIALDPFPLNAGPMTMEALWQGVPVVTLAGRACGERFGASILRAAGLNDWVVRDVDTYVERAARAAGDLDALAGFRTTLRPRLAASPLRDTAGLARCLEAVYLALRARMEPDAADGGGITSSDLAGLWLREAGAVRSDHRS